MNEVKDKLKFNKLWILLFIIPFVFGGFYDFASLIVGAFLGLFLIIDFVKNKRIKIEKNAALWISIVFLVGNFLTIFWAVDRSYAIFGFLKSVTIFLFVLNLFQIENKKDLLYTIPASAITMFFLSCILYIFPATRNIVFSDSNRLTGFFQYSNTYAIFLLIGAIVIFSSNLKNTKKILLMIICLIAILLTGSRITFFLTVLNFIILLCESSNKNRKWYLLAFFVVIAVAIIIAVLTNNFQNVGRFLTTSITSSTLAGRFVYFLDGFKILMHNWFGLGYMGYSYKYQEVQTAMYDVKFVHNDYLQIALDIGIIPAILFIIIVVKNLFSRTQNKINKIILFTLLIHIFFEFDLEFLSIACLLMLILSIREKSSDGKKINDRVSKNAVSSNKVTNNKATNNKATSNNVTNNNVKNNKTTKNAVSKKSLAQKLEGEILIKFNVSLIIIIAILVSILIYYGIAGFAEFTENYEFAIKLIPNYTEAIFSEMIFQLQEDNLKNANELANTILKNNENVSECYEVKATFLLKNNKFDEALQNQKKAISLNKYNIDLYNNYVLYLSQVIQTNILNEQYEKADKYIEEALNVEDMLEDVKNNTSKYAENFANKPTFSLNEEVQNYIITLKSK
jgi:O-antigen ligase